MACTHQDTVPTNRCVCCKAGIACFVMSRWVCVVHVKLISWQGHIVFPKGYYVIYYTSLNNFTITHIGRITLIEQAFIPKITESSYCVANGVDPMRL